MNADSAVEAGRAGPNIGGVGIFALQMVNYGTMSIRMSH